MKRLAYLRAEAADYVDTFEESIKEIEERLGNKKKEEEVTVHVSSDDSAQERKDVSSQIVKSKKEEKRDEPKRQRDEPRGKSVEEVHDKKEDEISTQYRKLWKAIAKITHPDVIGDDADMLALYKAAAAAHEKNRREELLDVASEVGIQLSNPHDVLIDDAQRRCLHYENMIRKIRDSIAWQWKNAPEPTQKEMIELILKSRNDKKTC